MEGGRAQRGWNFFIFYSTVMSVHLNVIPFT